MIYLWHSCSLLPAGGSRAGLPGWQSGACAGSWWSAGWPRPCPAGWWWRRAVAASWPARRTQSSPSHAASEPHRGTSPSSKPATWKLGRMREREMEGGEKEKRHWEVWQLQPWTGLCTVGRKGVLQCSTHITATSKRPQSKGMCWGIVPPPFEFIYAITHWERNPCTRNWKRPLAVSAFWLKNNIATQKALQAGCCFPLCPDQLLLLTCHL